jgi:carboxymethylenebutenolidase
VTDEIHSQATRLSQLGYHVVVPELYRGKLGVAAEEAEHLMGNLNWEGAVADVRNAAKYLRHMCVEDAPAVMSAPCGSTPCSAARRGAHPSADGVVALWLAPASVPPPSAGCLGLTG